MEQELCVGINAATHLGLAVESAHSYNINLIKF